METTNPPAEIRQEGFLFRKVCQRGNAKWEISSETTEAFYSLSDKPRQLNYEQT